ncbi:TetR/AcrR family transcriptional regulator [Nocardia sp. NPDC052112]|uniref:TetR/AcrR family transcriptional regulator n=1 Tax=Nocardia sp. NPDC052112 TaxID=3155646 RepID=UPI0034186281
MGQDEFRNEVRRRPGGRSTRVRTAVLQAALEALAELGPGGVTMSEIARRAGVHATSIQRRWGTTENVMLDALLDRSQEQLPIPDTGSLRGDMIALAQATAAYLATPLGIALARAMAVADDDPAIGSGRAEFWKTRYHAASVMIDRAVARNELAPETNPWVALEMLIAPLHFRALLVRQPVDDLQITQIVDTLLRGLTR